MILSVEIQNYPSVVSKDMDQKNDLSVKDRSHL